ncbi:diacylglycerol kinase family protein [Streptomyces sp. NPDC097981]|uniref:diacylglycerol/lipid kinase family protein n=1 Tax=Streptomyces sp. NPDC097981 TaxID=3155428 RepID=UPI00332A8E5C
MERRWWAWAALICGVAAPAVVIGSAGLRSVLVVLVGVVALAVIAACGWWVLAHRGLARGLALMLAVCAAGGALTVYLRAGLVWVLLLSLALWIAAGAAARTALASPPSRGGPAERPAARPERPFLIMNPRSGGGKVEEFRLRERAEALGAEVVLLDPDRVQDVAALARRAIDEGADLVGVAGGDGTQAAVAEVAAERGVPFVVISAGTRNHFAMDLGLDRDDPSTCLEALTDGVEVRVDLGFIGDRVFVNNASFGVYASVVQSPMYRDDKAGTILRVLPELLARDQGQQLTVRAEGTVVEAPQAVLVSNNPYQFGDPAGLGRRDRLDTGRLGVLGVNVDNAAQAAGLLRGRRAKGLTSVTAREAVVDSDAPYVDVGVDGEALSLPAPVRCRIEPGALRVVLPRGRPGTPPARHPMDWYQVRRLVRTALHGTPDPGPRRAAPGAS